MRVGAVDLGTNSTRLLVADVEEETVAEIVRHLAVTRLGDGVDQNRILLPAAIERVHCVLEGYAKEAADLGAPVLAVATSAVRDAHNGEDFLSGLEHRFGFTTRLLSGRDEAEMTFRGVSSGRTLAPETLLVDIGGGSTELVIGGPEGVSFASSLQIGCVRLTERFIESDPPRVTELERAAVEIRSLLPDITVASAIGVAGTVTTVATIDLGLPVEDPDRIHGHRITARTIEAVLESLASLPLSDRERIPGLLPARAPVIVGGLVVLREVMRRYGLDSIEVSERDILHGIALSAAGPL